MGVDCPILAMFNGNRSDENYIQLKMDKFMNGIECLCGTKIGSKNKIKPFCSVNDALCNHVIFPTFSFLKYYEKSNNTQSTQRQWALLIDVCKVFTQGNRKMSALGFTNVSEKTTVEFRGLYTKDNVADAEFPWSDLKIGHTLVVLYARRDGSAGEN